MSSLSSTAKTSKILLINKLSENPDRILKNNEVTSTVNGMTSLFLQSGKISQDFDNLPKVTPTCESAESYVKNLKAIKPQVAVPFEKQFSMLKTEATDCGTIKDRLAGNLDLERDMLQSDAKGVISIIEKAMDSQQDLRTVQGSQTLQNFIKKHLDKCKALANDVYTLGAKSEKLIKKLDIQINTMKPELAATAGITAQPTAKPN